MASSSDHQTPSCPPSAASIQAKRENAPGASPPWRGPSPAAVASEERTGRRTERTREETERSLEKEERGRGRLGGEEDESPVVAASDLLLSQRTSSLAAHASLLSAAWPAVVAASLLAPAVWKGPAWI